MPGPNGSKSRCIVNTKAVPGSCRAVVAVFTVTTTVVRSECNLLESAASVCICHFLICRSHSLRRPSYPSWLYSAQAIELTSLVSCIGSNSVEMTEHADCGAQVERLRDIVPGEAHFVPWMTTVAEQAHVYPDFARRLKTR